MLCLMSHILSLIFDIKYLLLNNKLEYEVSKI